MFKDFSPPWPYFSSAGKIKIQHRKDKNFQYFSFFLRQHKCRTYLPSSVTDSAEKKKVLCTFLYQDVAETVDTIILLKPHPPNMSLKDKEILFCILRAWRTAPGLLAVIVLKVIVNYQSVNLLTVFRDVWWMELHVANMNSKGTPCLDNSRTGCCLMKFEKSRYFPWEGA